MVRASKSLCSCPHQTLPPRPSLPHGGGHPLSPAHWKLKEQDVTPHSGTYSSHSSLGTSGPQAGLKQNPISIPQAHLGHHQTLRWKHHTPTQGCRPLGSAHLTHGDIPDLCESIVLPVLLLQDRSHQRCQECLCLQEEAQKYHQSRSW